MKIMEIKINVLEIVVFGNIVYITNNYKNTINIKKEVNIFHFIDFLYFLCFNNINIGKQKNKMKLTLSITIALLLSLFSGTSYAENSIWSDRETIQAKIERINQKIKKHYQNNQTILASAPEKITYPDVLDISETLEYKRIQQKALSCELSATADIISNLKKKSMTESFVERLLKKSQYNTLPTTQWNKTIWGNPNAWYVGYIHKMENGNTATQHEMTGYGVLEQPINEVYKTFNIKTKVITNQNYNHNYSQQQHLTEILKELSKWNMVQLWWDYCTTPKYEDTQNKNSCKNFYWNRELIWYYKEWNSLIKHTGLSWEHAFYLLWYTGGVENPDTITVWDTQTGKHSYPTSEWMRKWNMMQNRSIIAYK